MIYVMFVLMGNSVYKQINDVEFQYYCEEDDFDLNGARLIDVDDLREDQEVGILSEYEDCTDKIVKVKKDRLFPARIQRMSKFASHINPSPYSLIQIYNSMGYYFAEPTGNMVFTYRYLDSAKVMHIAIVKINVDKDYVFTVENMEKLKRTAIEEIFNKIKIGEQREMTKINICKCAKPPRVCKINTYNNKVVKVSFADGTFTKAVCSSNDTFNEDTGIMICLMKKMLGKDGNKEFNNMLRRARKEADSFEKEVARRKEFDAKMKENSRKANEKRREKNLAFKQELIDNIKSGVLLGMNNYYNGEELE